MAQIDEKQIEENCFPSLENFATGCTGKSTAGSTDRASSARAGVFGTAAEAIAAAKTAQASFVKLGFAKRREIIEAIKEASLANAKRLADLAVQDTKMGNAAHKVMKNEGAVTLSPGVDDLQSEAISGDAGTLLIEYVPFGVINSITPTTNPTSTVINHAIVMLSAGNAVVFQSASKRTRLHRRDDARYQRGNCKGGCSSEPAHLRCERQFADSKGDYGAP